VTNVQAIHSVGESLVTYLHNSYPDELRENFACQFRLVSSGEIADAANEFNQTTLSLYLYRVTMNEHMRSAQRLVEQARSNVPLSVDLHYLLSVWADNAPDEQIILAWAMRQLQQHPILDQSSLSSEAEWGPGEYIQLIPAELSNEDIMRIWDALEPSYRLSVSYIARVVRIDGDATRALPVIATRYRLHSTVQPGGEPALAEVTG
jgi:hypothetical protein